MGPLDIPISVLSVGLIMLGVVVVMLARSKQQEIYTGPVTTILPSYDADVANVQNMISAVNTISELPDLKELYSAPSTPTE